MFTTTILAEVHDERLRQHAKHGDQRHLPMGTGLDADAGWARLAKASVDRAAEAGTLTFRQILMEEVAEACAETDPDLIRAEMVQVAAVAVQIIEAIDFAKYTDPRRDYLMAADAIVEDEEQYCEACNDWH